MTAVVVVVVVVFDGGSLIAGNDSTVKECFVGSVLSFAMSSRTVNPSHESHPSTTRESTAATRGSS